MLQRRISFNGGCLLLESRPDTDNYRANGQYLQEIAPGLVNVTVSIDWFYCPNSVAFIRESDKLEPLPTWALHVPSFSSTNGLPSYYLDPGYMAHGEFTCDNLNFLDRFTSLMGAQLAPRYTIRYTVFRAAYLPRESSITDDVRCANADKYVILYVARGSHTLGQAGISLRTLTMSTHVDGQKPKIVKSLKL